MTSQSGLYIDIDRNQISLVHDTPHGDWLLLGKGSDKWSPQAMMFSNLWPVSDNRYKRGKNAI